MIYKCLLFLFFFFYMKISSYFSCFLIFLLIWKFADVLNFKSNLFWYLPMNDNWSQFDGKIQFRTGGARPGRIRNRKWKWFFGIFGIKIGFTKKIGIAKNVLLISNLCNRITGPPVPFFQGAPDITWHSILNINIYQIHVFVESSDDTFHSGVDIFKKPNADSGFALQVSED